MGLFDKKYCDVCGALKTVPVEADAARTSVNETWVCPSCGSEGQSKNFCENCGCARPAPKTVRCVCYGDRKVLPRVRQTAVLTL